MLIVSADLRKPNERTRMSWVNPRTSVPGKIGNKIINLHKRHRKLGFQTKRELIVESVFPLDKITDTANALKNITIPTTHWCVSERGEGKAG